MAVIHVEIGVRNLVWHVGFDAVSCRWVAKCDALNLTAEAETYGELQRDIDEAIQDLFEYLMERDELGAFLEGLGWRLAKSLPPERDKIRFDVPWAVVQLQSAQHMYANSPR